MAFGFDSRYCLESNGLCHVCPEALRRTHLRGRLDVQALRCTDGPHLEHSECCSTAEATARHYARVRVLVEGLWLADPGVTTEPRELADLTARPADILTSAAVPGRGAALDVCVASPSAAGAPGDLAEAAFERKLRRYRDIIPQLAAAGLVFRSLIWTCYGRPHPVTVGHTQPLRENCGLRRNWG